MNLTPRELAKRDEFDATYREARLPELRKVERQVCGCDYGATSWATRAEADLIKQVLALRHGLRLLEIGAGSGWPALYLVRESGCEAMLTDLPPGGLRIARQRSVSDGIGGLCMLAVADAARLPFAGRSFDAINHSDVLCCLVQKREVLAECRRVIRPDGRMVFSVIHVPCAVPESDRPVAVAAAPEFVEAEAAYSMLLSETGWRLSDRHDLTDAFLQSSIDKLRVDRENRVALLPISGAQELDRREDLMNRRIAALQRGILKRELFVAEPEKL